MIQMKDRASSEMDRLGTLCQLSSRLDSSHLGSRTRKLDEDLVDFWRKTEIVQATQLDIGA